MIEVLKGLSLIGVMVALFCLYYRWMWKANLHRQLTRKDIEFFLYMFVNGGRK